MGGEFQNLPLKSVCLGIYDCPHSTPKLSETGPFMARTQDIRQGFFDTDSAVHVNEEVYVERTKRVAPRYGDILFSREGTYFGDAAEVPENVRVCLGQRMVLLRPNPEVINPTYLRIQINSPIFQSMLSQYRDGTVAERLNLPVIRNLPVKVPSLKAQENVVTKIVCIEKKIELNRQMNATLEAMAQALFKNWFVDFDPVIDNALAAGNLIPEELQARANARTALGDKRKPLPEAIQKQFPSRFVLTEEMGWVPEGWEPIPLDQIANYQNGLALQKFRPENEADFLPVVKIAQLRQGYADGEEKASPNIKLECIIDNGDVVFSWSGSLMVDVWCGGKAALNQHLFKVTSKHYPKWFYYQYTNHHLIEFQRIAADKAVTMGHIKRAHLAQAYCASPPKRLLTTCSSLIESWMERGISCRLECKDLVRVRDTLLPKLLSGELRIPDAEKLAAEAV